MDAKAAALLGTGLAVGLAAFGASLGNGNLTGKAVEGIARNPEARGAISTTMFIGVALIEALPIIAVVVGFILMNK